jgi:anti-sigma factor RsiW
MFSKEANEHQIRDFILDYIDQNLSVAEVKSFEEYLSNTPELQKNVWESKVIRDLYFRMPVVKTGRNFDQRMAARFSLELERETTQRNKANDFAELITD